MEAKLKNRFTFYPSETVTAWLQAQPHKQAALNAAVEGHIQQQADATTNLDLLREAVSALHNLHTVFLELVSEVARMGERQ